MTNPFGKFFAALALAAMALSPLSVSAQKGEKSVGLKGGYNTCNESAVAGLYFQYRFSRWFRLSPDIDYVFRHHGSDAVTINLNAHVPFDFAGSRFSVYPLAGFSYSAWSRRHNVVTAMQSMTRSVETKTETERTKRFGINVGVGFEWRATSSLKIFTEEKFNWTKGYNAGVFCLGIGYVF